MANNGIVPSDTWQQSYTGKVLFRNPPATYSIGYQHGHGIGVNSYRSVMNVGIAEPSFSEIYVYTSGHFLSIMMNESDTFSC